MACAIINSVFIAPKENAFYFFNKNLTVSRGDVLIHTKSKDIDI